MDVAHEVRRFSEFLRLRIGASGMTQRAVERKLGWSTGYVSQLLRGNQDLKIKQVYAILDAIGASAAELPAGLARTFPAAVEGPAAVPLAGPAGEGELPRWAESPIQELVSQLRPMVRELVQEVMEAQVLSVLYGSVTSSAKDAGDGPPSPRQPAESSRRGGRPGGRS